MPALVGVRALRRRAAILGSLGATLLGLTGCAKPLSRDECDQLLDRYATRMTNEDRPGTSPAEQARILEKVRKNAAKDPAFISCTEEISRSQFECAMASNDLNQMERCLL
jgi:hypothetical protein